MKKLLLCAVVACVLFPQAAFAGPPWAGNALGPVVLKGALMLLVGGFPIGLGVVFGSMAFDKEWEGPPSDRFFTGLVALCFITAGIALAGWIASWRMD